jgi:hypothetical protein
VTLAELIAAAEDLANVIGEDMAEICEVRFAVNPAWPMQHDIQFLMLAHEDMDGPAVYLVDAGRVTNAPYLPEGAQKQIGWV